MLIGEPSFNFGINAHTEESWKLLLEHLEKKFQVTTEEESYSRDYPYIHVLGLDADDLVQLGMELQKWLTYFPELADEIEL